MKHLKLALSVMLALFLAGGTASADKIPQSKALQIASGFFKNSKGGIQQQMEVLRTSEDLPSLATKGTAGEPRFYIIGNKSGKGFVIVSADDRFSPILAYSTEHDFIEGEIPVNIEEWFLFLRNQMAWAEENGITDPESTAAWKEPMQAGKPVKELGTALWNQGYPYYNQCPMDGTSRSVTGCVATAVSEVMRYHKWPQTGKGTAYGYTCSSGAIVSTRKLSEHTYDWDNMPLNTSEYDNDTKRDAVATLMADVGAALQLDYSKNGTGGNAGKPALYQNFGYSSDAYYDYRANHTDNEWISILKDEIDFNRPIIYDGQDTSEGGHCFVIDGYDSSDYFHLNWGWGGSSNGYFKISALNPDPYKFNSDQDAIIGFRPSDGTEAEPNHWLDLYTPGLGCSSALFVQGGTYAIEPFMYTNTSLKDFYGSVGLFVTDKRGNIISQLRTVYLEEGFPAGKYTYSGYSSISVTINCPIKAGYRIRAFYKSTTGTEWIPMWREDANSSVKQEILIATDTDDVLEDVCSMKRSGGYITVTMPDGATAAVYDGASEVTEGVETTATTLKFDMTKMVSGKTYKFHIEYAGQTKEFKYTEK